jgi:hypothetical protein
VGLVPCMNRTTCSMSAREPATAGAARNGYITATADANLEMTAITKLSDQPCPTEP